MIIKPKSAVWKTYVGFSVQTENANRPIASYEWDFGAGGVPRINRTNIMKNEYQKVGTYNVRVKVTDENGNSNEIYDKVFIGEKDSPIIGYEVKDSRKFTLKNNDICEIKDES